MIKIKGQHDSAGAERSHDILIKMEKHLRKVVVKALSRLSQSPFSWESSQLPGHSFGAYK